jgi:hypothetical protein
MAEDVNFQAFLGLNAKMNDRKWENNERLPQMRQPYTMLFRINRGFRLSSPTDKKTSAERYCGEHC